MFVSVDSLRAPPVLEVPHSDGLVIGTAHYHLAVRVEDRLSHPIIVTDLKQDGVTMKKESVIVCC